MGRAGSDLAMETAHAVIVRDELATIPKVIALSRHARRVVIANLVIATTFITVLVLWDHLGHLPLPLGVAGHEGSSIWDDWHVGDMCIMSDRIPRRRTHVAIAVTCKEGSLPALPYR